MFRRYQLCVITVILSSLYMSAQSQIPDWFLNIGEDEYVGVSFPIKDAPEARHDFALMTAMMQHPAFNQQMKGVSSCRSTESGYSYISIYKLDTLIRFSYMQSDMSVNERGEEYVKIRFGQGHGCEMRLKIAIDELVSPDRCEYFSSVYVELKSDNGSSSTIRIFDKNFDRQYSKIVSDSPCAEFVIEVAGVTASGQQYMFRDEDGAYLIDSMFYDFINEVISLISPPNTKIGPKELKRLCSVVHAVEYDDVEFDKEAFRAALQKYFETR